MEKDYTTLRSFYDPVEAELARARLETAGLDVVLLDGHINRADPLLIPATHGIRLQVRRADQQQAESLLGAGHETASVSEEEPEDVVFSTVEGDAWMRRAAAASVIGTITFFFPLSLYAVWLVLAHLAELRSSKGTRMMAVTIVFTLVSFAGWGIVIQALVQP